MSKKQKIVKEVKRFVVSKGNYGKGLRMRFTNRKGETYEYDHDEVVDGAKEHLEGLNCWKVYKNYTATNNIAGFAKPFAEPVETPES